MHTLYILIRCLTEYRSLCFSKHNAQYIVFGDSQGKLHCINDLRMFSMSQSQHMGSVRSIRYTACGELIVSCAEDKTGIL